MKISLTRLSEEVARKRSVLTVIKKSLQID